eukprot:TRINITY_DN32779_c0_g2_i3.p1 TRINITY_DN32779_c0_g2~~TRINITY_DN32779_c0_g2_i3.p1  ORF type:complete len:306 (-),score=80.25 TRINITY_DN32779_c0_g2_i3:231-1148(-)
MAHRPDMFKGLLVACCTALALGAASSFDGNSAAFLIPKTLPIEPRAALRAAPGVAQIHGVATEATSAQSARVTSAVALLAAAALALGLSRSSKTERPWSRQFSSIVRLKATEEDKEAEKKDADAAADDDEDDEEDDVFSEDEDSDEDDDIFSDEDGLTTTEMDYDEDDDDLYREEEEGEKKLEIRCLSKWLKGSPMKYRRVLWQIRGRSYRDALMILEFMPFRHCRPTLHCLQSAAANAQNVYNMDKTRLYISRCQAWKGPTSKRMRPVSKGQAHPYTKKQTHLEIFVAEMDDEQMEKANRMQKW